MSQLTSEKDDLKTRVTQINDYLWARYIEVTDDYPHELNEDEALADLERFYEKETENQDVVYLGILLFERGFVDEDKKLEHFKRAYLIFERYRRLSGETDWDVVEDRLEDIRAFFEEEGIDPSKDVKETDGSPDGMVLVPAGPFLCGENREATEVTAFYIDIHPVTNAQYNEFCSTTGYRVPRFHDDPRFNQPNQPVVGVSVADALQYCNYVGKELPTATQWEKAARGTDGRRFPWGNEAPSPNLAHFDHDVDAGRPADVGKQSEGASPYGCLDMAGNVWEWTSSSPEDDPGRGQILRGGCYEDPADFLATFTSVVDDQKSKSEVIGFRCVKKVG